MLEELVVKVGANTNQFTYAMDQIVRSSSTAASQLVSHWTSASAKIAAAIGGYGLMRLSKDFLQVGIAAETMTKSLSASTGGMNEASDSIQFLRQQSERLGTVFQDQISGFQRLSAAGIPLKYTSDEIKMIWLGLAEAGTAMQMTGEQMQHTMVAIEQTMSKGKVSTEELRQQLSESLPGAFAHAAAAMQMTVQDFSKALAKGSIDSKAFVLVFTDYLRKTFAEGLSESLDTTSRQLNRLKNTWYDLQTAVMGGATMSEIAKALKELNKELRDWLNSNRELIQQKVPEWINTVKERAKDVFDFIMANKDLSEFGLIGYLMFGKQGFLIGSLMGTAMGLLKKAEGPESTAGWNITNLATIEGDIKFHKERIEEYTSAIEELNAQGLKGRESFSWLHGSTWGELLDIQQALLAQKELQKLKMEGSVEFDRLAKKWARPTQYAGTVIHQEGAPPLLTEEEVQANIAKALEGGDQKAEKAARLRASRIMALNVRTAKEENRLTFEGKREQAELEYQLARQNAIKDGILNSETIKAIEGERIASLNRIAAEEKKHSLKIQQMRVASQLGLLPSGLPFTARMQAEAEVENIKAKMAEELKPYGTENTPQAIQARANAAMVLANTQIAGDQMALKSKQAWAQETQDIENQHQSYMIENAMVGVDQMRARAHLEVEIMQQKYEQFAEITESQEKAIRDAKLDITAEGAAQIAGLEERLAQVRKNAATEIAAHTIKTEREITQIKLGNLSEMLGNTAAVFQQISQVGGKHNETMFTMYKAFAIAQAMISAHLAALRALESSSPPFSYIMAGMSYAMAMVQVAAIMSAKPPSMDTGGITTTPGLYYAGVPEAHIPLSAAQGKNIPVSIGRGSSNITIVQMSNPVFQDQETQRAVFFQIAEMVARKVAPGAVEDNYYADGSMRRIIRSSP
jgi:tape measure domain-containing protein